LNTPDVRSLAEIRLHSDAFCFVPLFAGVRVSSRILVSGNSGEATVYNEITQPVDNTCIVTCQHDLIASTFFVYSNT